MRLALVLLLALTSCAGQLRSGASRSIERQHAAGVEWQWQASSPRVTTRGIEPPGPVPAHDLRGWIESTPAPADFPRETNGWVTVRVLHADYWYGRRLRCGNDRVGVLSYSVVLELEAPRPGSGEFRLSRQGSPCDASLRAAELSRCLDRSAQEVLDDFFLVWRTTDARVLSTIQ